MQIEGQYYERLNAITHSPYYGCTVRVVSKARVSYEGVLDGISTNKDRIFLKNVRVNGNIASSPIENNPDDLNRNNTSDTLNAVMIDHLTNDIRTYEQVCLNVRDILELRLIQFPSTFHESKAKLRAIDPCLVDIRLSPSDEYETGSNNDHRPCAPIARQKRCESFGSNGGSALLSSSSNESSSSFGLRSGERFANESNDESIDEQVEKFSQLRTTNVSSKPVTLLAKKVLPKKIERRTDVPRRASLNVNNNLCSTLSDNREAVNAPTRVNNPSVLKKGSVVNQNRGSSPIRVTITSNLNPNAIPFFTQQRNLPAIQNPSFTFYEQPSFRPRIQPVISPDRSQSMPYGINAININNHHHHHHQQQQQNHHYSHQRFVPPRQMANKKNFTQTNTRPIRPPPPIMKYRIRPSTTFDKRSYPQQQQQQQQQQHKRKSSNNVQFPEYMRQTSLPSSIQSTSKPQIQQKLAASRNTPPRDSPTSIRSTASLPFQYGSPGDHNQLQRQISYGEPIGSHRHQRTVSGASSCSSLSLDIGPHSIVQFDSSSSNALISFEGQYDFEKANEEFRRYLALEELVSRCTPPRCSTEPSLDDNSTQQQQQQSNSYKKEISFFDRISCTATTGTAVGYTEMDETEKNLETFGDDALLMPSTSNDDE